MVICSLMDLTTQILTAFCLRRHDPSQPARKICVQKNDGSYEIWCIPRYYAALNNTLVR
jgi:hypothetical protein